VTVTQFVTQARHETLVMGLSPLCLLVGVAGFEPTASSSRTAHGRLQLLLSLRCRVSPATVGVRQSPS
jgi:hypothetical protein